MTSQGNGPVLGIETSCDETAAAVLAPGGEVLAARLWSQTEEHAPYAGVVPEIAARAHLARLPGMIEAVLDEAAVAPAAVAATAGPGLIGGLIVGANLGKGFALARGLPFYAVNHLEAHALSARLPGLAGEPPSFPYLTLLVSGGHCLLVETRGPGAHALLGRTLDDAPGEAFDKVAKMLGLGWPGGPALERLAAGGDPARFALPRPMLGRAGFDFSFSGLKTAVATIVAGYQAGALPERDAADLAAGFQARVAWTLADRARRAMRAATSADPDQADVADRVKMRGGKPRSRFRQIGNGSGCRVLVVSGGVAANGVVREALRAAASAEGFALAVPPPALCTDNAIMVAWAAIERRRAGDPGEDLAVPPRPRWPLSTAPGAAPAP